MRPTRIITNLNEGTYQIRKCFFCGALACKLNMFQPPICDSTGLRVSALDSVSHCCFSSTWGADVKCQGSCAPVPEDLLTLFGIIGCRNFMNFHFFQGAPVSSANLSFFLSWQNFDNRINSTSLFSWIRHLAEAALAQLIFFTSC